MKRNIFFMLLLAMMSMKLTAQVNPQKGYVITNENDTIYGTIDYLTDAQNVKACLFQKAGESEYKSLSPSLSHSPRRPPYPLAPFRHFERY